MAWVRSKIEPRNMGSPVEELCGCVAGILLEYFGGRQDNAQLSDQVLVRFVKDVHSALPDTTINQQEGQANLTCQV